ncbi:MAG: type I DNA topoisomerase [Planctomycetota bacterium]
MTKSRASKRKSLVIVESPAKARTINKYLGSAFEVKASMGHVRDLPSKGLNVDLDNDFEPTYAVPPGKKRTVVSLQAAAKDSDTLYLATDLDREGEAIAWHLSELLNIPVENTYRVIFNAITGEAIKAAFAKPGKLDMDKVMAQQARRILDRIVGYQISPLLWKKVASGLSAGRVQSVAVKMIVERERQIRAFNPQEYWLIPAVFTKDIQSDYSGEWARFTEAGSDEKKGPTLAQQNKWLEQHNSFKAELATVGPEKFSASDEAQAQKVYDLVRGARFVIGNIEKKSLCSRPSPPFITSTMQQSAANRLGFTASRTMRIAQQLYEGLDLGSMGMFGLITYMRTDSTHLSQEAIQAVRKYIEVNAGQEYLPPKPNFFASGKNAQQAHEAVRPTDPDLTPDDLQQYLSDEQYRLYKLIWSRFIASQCVESQSQITTLEIAGTSNAGKCCYRAGGRVLIFDGFTRFWSTGSADQHLPMMNTGDEVGVVSVKAEQHFTKPPARYTEAALVKALEKEGIGRPSTYAAIISTIQDRNYVEKIDKTFHPTDIGEIVTDKLSEHFPNIMDMAFTRHMEEQLDKIEEQHLDWTEVLREFYGPFKANLDRASEEMKHAKAETSPSEYICTECGREMVYRFGKNGRFLSCSAYPDCKFSRPCDKEGKIIEDMQSREKCPVCGKNMVYKTGRFGQFLGCSDYPKCKTILNVDKDGNVLPPKPPPEPTGINCYKCKAGQLVIRQSKKGPFLGCNKFPKCRTIISIKQLEHLKELQARGKWPPASNEEADALLGRRKKAGTRK